MKVTALFFMKQLDLTAEVVKDYLGRIAAFNHKEHEEISQGTQGEDGLTAEVAGDAKDCLGD